MDYYEKIAYAHEQWYNEHYDECVNTCGTILETALKEIVFNLEKHLDVRSIQKIREAEAEIGCGKMPISQFTLGKLSGLYRMANIFELVKIITPSPLNKTLGVDLDLAVKWRNAATHMSGDPIANLDARLMWIWTASILSECCLVDENIDTFFSKSKEELEDNSICDSCEKRVGDDWHYCAYCGSPLKLVCPFCSRPIEHSDWKVCPYCEERLTEYTDRQSSLNRREYQILCRGIWSDSVKNAKEAGFLDTRRKELGLTYNEAREIEQKEAPNGALDYELALKTTLDLQKDLISEEQFKMLRKQAYALGLDIHTSEMIEEAVFTNDKKL